MLNGTFVYGSSSNMKCGELYGKMGDMNLMFDHKDKDGTDVVYDEETWNKYRVKKEKTPCGIETITYAE